MLPLPAFTKTVRFKLTLWYSGLMLIFGVAFIVSLNLAARFDRPDVIITGVETIQQGPGGAIIFGDNVDVKLRNAEDSFYQQNLKQLRTWSLVSIIGLAVASGIGGYMLSGMLLRPVRDITDVASKISATNLSRRINHQGPDDELKTLADTFDLMIGRLERSFLQQRLFVQDASHELRTPLAAIRTNIEVLEMDPDASTDEYRELLELVKTQTARLARLSEDLMLLSTTEGETPDLDTISIAALADEVVAQLDQSAAQRDVTLVANVPADVTAFGNADLLFRCVFNLVENAVKYSGSGSTVSVSGRNDNAMVAVHVSDNGSGISAEHLGRIFDRFYRVDRGRARREGGSGLGLAIVKELVTSMDGEVAVASQVGQGTTFTIRLPRPGPDLPERETETGRGFEPARVSG